MKCYINLGIKEAEIIQMSGIKWIEEAVLCANLSFASDRCLFIIRRVASFHLGAESRQLSTDKCNVHQQYCMLGISAFFC